MYEDTRQPIPFHTYVIVVPALGAMAFVLVNVGADHEIHVDVETLMRDLRWAGVLRWCTGCRA